MDPNSPDYLAYYNSQAPSTQAFMRAPGSADASRVATDEANSGYTFDAHAHATAAANGVPYTANPTPAAPVPFGTGAPATSTGPNSLSRTPTPGVTTPGPNLLQRGPAAPGPSTPNPFSLPTTPNAPGRNTSSFLRGTQGIGDPFYGGTPASGAPASGNGLDRPLRMGGTDVHFARGGAVRSMGLGPSMAPKIKGYADGGGVSPITYQDYLRYKQQTTGGDGGGGSGAVDEATWSQLSPQEQFNNLQGGTVISRDDPRYAAMAQQLGISNGSNIMINGGDMAHAGDPKWYVNPGAVINGQGWHATGTENQTPYAQQQANASGLSDKQWAAIAAAIAGGGAYAGFGAGGAAGTQMAAAGGQGFGTAVGGAGSAFTGAGVGAGVGLEGATPFEANYPGNQPWTPPSDVPSDPFEANYPGNAPIDAGAQPFEANYPGNSPINPEAAAQNPAVQEAARNAGQSVLDYAKNPANWGTIAKVVGGAMSLARGNTGRAGGIPVSYNPNGTVPTTYQPGGGTPGAPGGSNLLDRGAPNDGAKTADGTDPIAALTEYHDAINKIDPESYATRAMADAKSADSASTGDMQRNLARSGRNPYDAAGQSLAATKAVGDAANEVGAANNARLNATSAKAGLMGGYSGQMVGNSLGQRQLGLSGQLGNRQLDISNNLGNRNIDLAGELGRGNLALGADRNSISRYATEHGITRQNNQDAGAGVNTIINAASNIPWGTIFGGTNDPWSNGSAWMAAKGGRVPSRMRGLPPTAAMPGTTPQPYPDSYGTPYAKGGPVNAADAFANKGPSINDGMRSVVYLPRMAGRVRLGGLGRKYANGGKVLDVMPIDDGIAPAKLAHGVDSQAAPAYPDSFGKRWEAGSIFMTGHPAAMLGASNGRDSQPAPSYPDSFRRSFEKGGDVEGPGTETSDSIPAKLSDGEFVVNAEAVKLLDNLAPGFLDKINDRGLRARSMRARGLAR